MIARLDWPVTGSLGVVDEGLHRRGTGGDGIPGHHRDPGEQRAQGAGGVAVDDDLALGLAVPLDPQPVLARRLGLGPLEPGQHRALVQLDGLLLALQLLADGMPDLVQVQAQHLRGDAHVDHVLDQLLQLGLGAAGRHQALERHRTEVQVAAQGVQLERLVVDQHRARAHLGHVLLGRLRVHADHEVDALLAGLVAAPAGPDLEPGGQPRDVGGEQVLAGDRHPHLEDGAHQHDVCGLGAGTVDGGHLNGKIIHKAIGRQRFCRSRLGEHTFRLP